ncbi:MAG: hypothetical protein WCJ17_02025, partial [bacterium]
GVMEALLMAGGLCLREVKKLSQLEEVAALQALGFLDEVILQVLEAAEEAVLEKNFFMKVKKRWS